jgi:2-hydroxychromene-2-carboxylate isomerase
VLEPLKLYFDYKSPFAYLASQRAFELPERFQISLHWIPYLLRLKGPGQRSIYSDWKAQYSYADARRFANRRGGFKVMGPRKIYDSTPALLGGLFAQREGFFRPYTEEVYRRFFERRLEIDRPEEIAGLIAELGGSAEAYAGYRTQEGELALEAAIAQGHADHVFGVPLFIVRGEQFWGNDRMALLEERLTEYGLRR